MTCYEFLATFTEEEDGKYSVDFPDIEGCHTCGDNLNDAFFMARDALKTVLRFRKSNNQPMPVAHANRENLALKKNQDAYTIAVDLDDDYISDEKEKKEDPVNHPSHYEKQCSLECIDVMEAVFEYDAVFDFCVCNAFKYLWRHKFKNGEEDIKKAEWYINKAETIMYDVGDEEHLMGKLIKVQGLYKKVEKKEANIDSE